MRSSDIVILKNLFFARITYASDRRESQCGVRSDRLEYCSGRVETAHTARCRSLPPKVLGQKTATYVAVFVFLCVNACSLRLYELSLPL